jgi:beta-mannosidase
MKNPIAIKLSILSFLFLFLHSFGISQDMNQINLGGTWKFKRAGSDNWMDGKVPGVVHLDLLKNGVISDPFNRENETFQQWIGEVGWEYQRSFYIPDSLFRRRNIELVCKGLDTYANVFLNDSLILVADNMFRTWYAPVKYKLHSGLNVIRVQFPGIIAENKSRYDALKYKLPGDEKVVCRKAAYQFGWDWGPTFITSGIWQPIYLRYWDYVNVMGVQYIQRSLTDSLALMTAEFTLNSMVPDSAVFSIGLNGKEIARTTSELKKGTNVIRVDFEIRNPKRWWSNGIGDPYLYPFEHKVIFIKKVVGSGIIKIGLRTLELVQEKDTSGKTFYFKLNGIPVFMKGANYIPMDNFLPRVKDSSYQAIVKTAVNAHMNMLRVWGGGIYENDAFYDYCDENGILVWQDFMFACAMYPGGKDFIANVKTEAIQQVVRLRNHPCIGLWCGNNEIDEAWKNWGWQKQYNYSPADSAEISTNYKIIFEETLKNAVEQYDAKTPYIPTSPMNGWGRAESLKEGDLHYWGVWHGKEPFDMYDKKVGRFVSEYGFQGFPDMTTINQFTAPNDRKLDSPVMKVHQKSPIGFERIDEYMLQSYKKPKDFNAYVYVSQLLQADGMKRAIEAHRRAKPYCMGTLFWQLNDCWPVVSWSSMDYLGKKKALYYRLYNEYADLLVSPAIGNNRVKVYLISDKLVSQKGILTVEMLDFSGNTIWNRTLSVDIAANSSSVAFDTSLLSITTSRKTSELLLLVQLSSGDKLLAENILYFEEPKDQNLSIPKIEKKATETPDGYKIELTTDKLARGVKLTFPFKGELSDNYFDLVPGRTKTINFTTAVKTPIFTDWIRITNLAATY